MTPPGETLGESEAAKLKEEILAVRETLIKALDPGTGEISPRKQALLRDVLRRCNRLAAAAGLTTIEGVSVSLESAADSRGLILAGRQAASEGRHPISILIVRHRAGVEGGPSLSAVRRIADLQLRSIGDVTRLLEHETALAITLESDRPGALVALRRIARAVTQQSLQVSRLEYSLTELDPTADGEGLVRRAGEGFRTLSVDPERSTPKRVLVVDDDASVLSVIVEHLEACGLDLHVESTLSAFEACARFRELEPDLVILDIRMPEIDGRDALATMKRAVGGREVRFIAASAMPELFPEMRRRGCDDCLQKPFDLEELAEMVASRLGLPSLRSEAA